MRPENPDNDNTTIRIQKSTRDGAKTLLEGVGRMTWDARLQYLTKMARFGMEQVVKRGTDWLQFELDEDQEGGM